MLEEASVSRDLTEDDCVEVLPSLSIAETQACHRDYLGFDDIAHIGPDYLIIRRDFLCPEV